DGGAGADTMTGGAGNDTYTVDNVGDVVLELPGAGTDEVRSSISYVLGLSVENLALLGSVNHSATGNAEANLIIGNAGNNVIIGALGQDTLTGNAGADAFVFQRVEETGNTQASGDRITDFQSAQSDRIDLSGIDADVSTLADDAFMFIGSSAFTSAAQVRSFLVSGVTYVALNTDTNLASAEAIILLTGAFALAQSDFVL
ncbi:MAG: calcium-binding protein, partial [Cyanobacteriota bacterium]